MSGVIREILESEGGSMSGEEDFFSVARTIPLVAGGDMVSLESQGGGIDDGRAGFLFPKSHL
jgi:hypothetical protein